jgi:UDP-N-acetylglucosamine--N-acetylmuramyl-(pentapeptide) pyrophosphoryl-undecaprenol N-acetylglucosamine transferase
VEALFVCDRAFSEQSRGLMRHARIPVAVKTIASGKLRRYHGIPLWRQLLDIPTIVKNLLDVFKIVTGFVQSLWLLLNEQPDIVFAKGGFVCLPMGYAARVVGIPVVLHDSDTRPGLTNRLLSRFAVAIATGAPLENYTYESAKSRYVGVPIATEFRPVAKDRQAQLKKQLKMDPKKPLVVVTGGGLGAKSINEAIVNTRTILLDRGVQLYHVCGKKHYKKLKGQVGEDSRYRLVPFVYKDMYKVLGAADIVVSRASATFTQELAGLRKPTILVPAAHLGDQVKNAEMYAAADAAVVLEDRQIIGTKRLAETIVEMVEYPKVAEQRAERLYAFARPHAARDTARMVYEVARKGSL